MNNLLEKIVVNSGVGKFREKSSFENKILPEISKQMAAITGQKPSFKKAKKSISSFKIREGDIIGLTVTLRGRLMNDFLKRLVNITLPRKKDFKGIDKKSVDSSGNLTIGFKDQYAFPEVEMDKSEVNFGLEVTLVPKDEKNKNREKTIEIFKKLGIPFR